MSRRGKFRDIHGVVLLDKPAGVSSSSAVQKVRGLFRARKAGHTGTLDPFATGMLPICLGEATKTAGFMQDAAKTYQARAFLGRATTTGDVEGDICATAPVPALSSDEIKSVLHGFVGVIRQIPPMYSALKHHGQPLYRLARAGQEVPRESREVTVHELQLLAWEPPMLEFRLRCSKGTYVRTLAEDIACAMGSCAHLQMLRRLQVEPFRQQDMLTFEALTAAAEEGRLDQCLLPPDAGVSDWSTVRLDDEGARRFEHGNPVRGPRGHSGLVRVHGAEGRLLGLGEVSADGWLKVRRLMQLHAPEEQ